MLTRGSNLSFRIKDWIVNRGLQFVTSCCLMTFLWLIAKNVVRGEIEQLENIRSKVQLEKYRTEALRSKLEELNQQTKKLEDDERYLERVIRDNLVLSRDNEVVVIFDD